MNSQDDVKPSHEIQGTFFALITAILRSFGILCCVYLQSFKDASAGQVLFVVEFGVFLQMVLYVAANKEARHHFRDFATMNTKKERNLHKKMVLFYRSVSGGVSTLMLYISGYYLQTGDIGALYNISIILFSFFAALYSFSKKPTKLTLFGIPIAIIGILCICQPSFLFDSESGAARGLSLIGVLSVCFGGFLRSFCNLIVNTNINIHWSLIVLCTSFICSFVAVIALILEYAYNYYVLHDENYVVWSTFSSSTADCVVSNLILYSMAIRSSVLMILITLTFQLGNYLKLEIILSTAEVLFCYILEYLLLNVHSNRITYFGVVCIIVSSIPINYEIYKTKHESDGYSQVSSAEKEEPVIIEIELEDSLINIIIAYWIKEARLQLLHHDHDVKTFSPITNYVK